MSPGTVHGHHRVLHKALADAVKLEYVGRNVAEAVDLPRRPKTPARVWTREETRRFLEVAKGSRYYALYALAATTGLREGELPGLRWSDVDLERGVISVQRELVKAGKQPVFEEVKSESSLRPIQLSRSAASLLRDHKARQDDERRKWGERWRGLDLVFTGGEGTAIHPQNLRSRDFRPLLEKAEVPRIRIHDLRHACKPPVAGRRTPEARTTPPRALPDRNHDGSVLSRPARLSGCGRGCRRRSLARDNPDSDRGFAPDLQSGTKAEREEKRPSPTTQ